MNGVIIGGACALVAALIFILGPGLTLALLLAAVAVAILCLRPAWSVYATIIVGLTAFPSFIPYSIQLGSITVFLFEPFLLIAAVWAIATHPSQRAAKRRAWLLTALIGLAAVRGMAAEHPTFEVIGDGRGLLTVVLSLILASRLYGTPYANKCLKVLKYSLWVSLGVVALSMVFKFKLAGRTEAAALFLSSSGAGASETTRFLTAASQISVLVVCVTLALALTKRATGRQVAPFLVPALLMTFLSFSRNSIIAVAVAVVIAIILARTMKPVTVAAKFVAVAALPVLVLVLAHASFGLPGGNFVAAQIDAFNTRVIGGLDASTLSDDTSAIARLNEDAYLMKAIGESPVVGHGFGYAYRPPAGPAGSFSATKGQYYGHNFYLWLTSKTGVLGLAAFFAIAITPVIACFGRRTNETIALGAAMSGLLVSMVFAPFPNDVGNGGSLAVGLLLGALIAATDKQPGEPKLSGRRARTLVGANHKN